MSANEIKNISHAGIVCRFIDDATPPIIEAAWGLDDEEGFTSQSATAVGLYTIPLQEPIGALTDPVTVDELVEIGAIVLSSPLGSLATPLDGKLQVSLQNLEFLLTPSAPLDSDIQLDVLAFRITDNDGVAADGALVANAYVLRMPQRE